MRLKSLVHGWWLMYAPGDGFEIVDRKREWITISIPAYDVKRMVTIVNAIHPGFFLGADQEIAFLVNRHQFFRTTNVALTVGRMFQQLSLRAQVFFWKTDGTNRLHDE